MELPTGVNWPEAESSTLFEMSMRYANGDGVEMNYIIAHIFLNIAASKGCEKSAEYRKELAFEMEGKEISKAQKIARELLFGPKSKIH